MLNLKLFYGILIISVPKDLRKTWQLNITPRQPRSTLVAIFQGHWTLLVECNDIYSVAIWRSNIYSSFILSYFIEFSILGFETFATMPRGRDCNDCESYARRAEYIHPTCFVHRPCMTIAFINWVIQWGLWQLYHVTGCHALKQMLSCLGYWYSFMLFWRASINWYFIYFINCYTDYLSRSVCGLPLQYYIGLLGVVYCYTLLSIC